MASFVTTETHPDLCRHYRDAGWWSGEALGDLLAGALQKSRHRSFTVHTRAGAKRISLAQLASWGRRVAGGLQRLGVGPGDAVAFQLANSLPAAAVFYGLVHLGALLVPIGHAMGRSELLHALDSSGARAVFVEAGSANREFIDDITRGGLPISGLEHVIVVGDAAGPPKAVRFDVLAGGEEASTRSLCDPAAPAVIGWTSGSTAEPKGVLLSHRALCAEVRLHMAPLLSAGRRPVLSTSPISHVTGMLMSLLVPPLVGHDIHLMDYWNPGDVAKIMTKRSLAAGSGAPVFLHSLLDDPECGPEQYRLIDLAALGGASVPAGLIERADTLGITAVKGYGCTEHPSISLGRSGDPLALRAGTDGQVCTGVQVRIRDADGIHHDTGTGEIITRGPDLFSGYVDTTLNAEAFDHGWYRTGDVGTLYDDGHLTVVDRLKDIIIRSGLNVSASEVETALARMPEIADVAVVAAPNARTGEHGCAFVRPVRGHAVPDLARIREHLAAAGLSKYKWPEEIREHRRDFPRSPAGKVRKAALRELARRPADGQS